MAHGGRKKADEALALALACGATVEQAAQKAGVSARTAHRRLAAPAFQRRVREAKVEMVQRATAVLTAAGGGFGDVVRTTIYLVDLGHFGKVNEAYGACFEAPFPARATVQVSALPKGAQLEIDMVAVRQA